MTGNLAVQSVRDEAETINHEHRLAQASAADAVEHAIQCGQLLSDQKAKLPHGQWESWVAENCEFSTNRATRYMKAAKLALTQDLDGEGRLAISRDIWGNTSRGGGGSVVERYTGEDEWYTPALYVDAARRVLGQIDLDPATNDKANEVVQAAQIFTADDDGLAHDWHGSVFLNPPYKQPLVTQFVEKLVASFESGGVDAAILLTNNSTDTRWWQHAANAATAACFTAGRIKFYRDREYDAPTNGQVFLYFGPEPELFAQEFSEFGFLAVPAGG